MEEKVKCSQIGNFTYFFSLFGVALNPVMLFMLLAGFRKNYWMEGERE